MLNFLSDSHFLKRVHFRLLRGGFDAGGTER